MERVNVEDKVVQFMSCICPEEKDVIQEPPPKLPRDEDGAGCHHGLLQPSHEEVGQRRCHGCAHSCSKHLLEQLPVKFKHIVLQNMIHDANKFFNWRAIGGGSIVKKMMEGSVEVVMGDIGVQSHHI